MKNSLCEKIWRLKFEHKMTFDNHLRLIKKARKQICSPARITSYKISRTCSFLWTCHSRANNSKVNRLQKRSLRIIYSDKTSSFWELLEKEDSVSIHKKIVSFLLLKCKRQAETWLHHLQLGYWNKEISIILIWHITVAIWKFNTPSLNLAYHETESISFLGHEIWKILPDRLNNYNFVEDF